jgi:hypothetical protein
MANIGLKGTAQELGITVANLWLQPACKANGYSAIEPRRDRGPHSISARRTDEAGSLTDGLTRVRYDALAGCEAYMADPLGVPKEMIPVGICFPSTKDGDNWEGSDTHTCQILVPAEWSW